ncbi:hypothetical protein PsorP6_001078 [Peronosclerospora sorghi]|uniref:Uncharacterized protein n=1 Tax=Peronosclerospora sorghi TaxID=230839 RepID=A0ACC0WYG0_9STRA|nr:hypothetical protein PsorP6_001078 [Peronosclerospora sorghi]
MEATVSVCLVMGIVAAVLALTSGACYWGCPTVCVLSPLADMMTLILSAVTLVPIGACLITVWMDTFDAKNSGQLQPLLAGHDPVTSKNPRQPRRVRTYLYASHLLSAWVTRADGMHKPEWTLPLTLLFAGLLICGGVGQVLNDAQTLGIERDWVVVIAGSNNSAALDNLNTTLRRIDLTCNILGPMAFGFIVDFTVGDAPTRAIVGAAVVGIWNLISTPLEYCMMHDVYHLVPELAVSASVDEGIKVQTTSEVVFPTSTTKSSTRAWYRKLWVGYVNHPVFLVSFSFCALYMTILSGGALNTAYLKWRGISNVLLGASRGAGAVAGLVGTWIFSCLRNGMKRVEHVAVLSVWFFWLCLAPVLLAFLFTGESVVSDYVMLTSVVLSRTWLWSKDLAEMHIMQEWIAPNQRGAFNSMQTATCQFFFILIMLTGVVFHNPMQFQALVLFSLGAVLASALGFTYWTINYGRHRDIYVPTKRVAPT